MKEYFFVKVKIGIIAERGVFLKLIDEIESLIDMHQEGAYWDFKREWYGNNKDGDFVTCGKSYYINAGYIKDVTKTEIILRGGEQIFIPIRLQKELCLLWQMKVNNNIL